MWLLFCLTFLFYLPKTSCFPEPGLWKNFHFPHDKEFSIFTKSMYKDTVLSLQIDCYATDVDVTITWMLKRTPCLQEYQAFVDKRDDPQGYVNKFLSLFSDASTENIKYDNSYEYIRISKTESCNNRIIYLEDQSAKSPEVIVSKDFKATQSDEEGPKNDEPKRQNSIAKGSGTKDGSQSVEDNIKTVKRDGLVKTSLNGLATSKNDDTHNLAKVWKSGYYVFILKITSPVNNTRKFDANLTLSMRGQVGYISAVEWPLLIFYGVMGLIYIIYGVIWLVMLACNWRDIMRLQYWIGGVIVLGMLEKAVFYAEYQSIANTGISVTSGAVIIAEVVSSLKRTLARMLVIIVSVGFGIVKPRLGPTFHKVLCVGGLYFVLASIEGSFRSLKPKGDQSSQLMLTQVPIAVVDACICWWIFSSLVQTTRQLRLRRNIVKLSLYKHFTNILIFAVIASLIFMIWSTIEIKFKACIQNWNEIWIDEAIWHLLFSVLLAVIMILWRPSANNQRYAFSPLIDAADEDDRDENDADLNDAFDGMKARSKNVNGSAKQKQSSIEDDLKWVEENIPLTLSDKAQTFLDSDEEVETAKYEVSKMQ